MRREIMKRAWELFRKGFNKVFARCLKASWELYKKETATLKEETLSQETLNSMMKNDRNFRRKANGSNLSSNIIYKGEGKVYYNNFKLWIKEGICRLYADKNIDNVSLDQTYIQVRI